MTEAERSAEGVSLVPSWVHATRFDLDDLEGLADGTLHARFRHVASSDRVDVLVGSGPTRDALLRRERCWLKYTTSLTQLDAPTRFELGALMVALADACDAWLRLRSAAAPADLVASFATPLERIEASPAGLLQLLAPEVAVGQDVVSGWRLEGLYPSSYFSDSLGDQIRLVLELRHATEGKLHVEVSRRDDRQQAFARTSHFDVSYLTLGGAPARSAERAARHLGLVLRLRDHAGLKVEFPRAGDDLVPVDRQLNPTAASSDVLNLSIDAACGQSCAFCSVQDVSPPRRGGLVPRLERYLRDLQSNAAAGLRRVRLNGYDPLAFEGILDVARAMRELGYDRVDVFSPCTRLADAAFLDALLTGLPERTCFYVPVYGATAATHDGVVGVTGAFDCLKAAVENLRGRVPRERLFARAVAVRSNLDELCDLRDWAASWAFTFTVHTPFPSTESPADRFRESAPSLRAIAEATFRAPNDVLRVEGVPPCVYWRRAREVGIPPGDWLDDAAPAPLPGRAYGLKGFRHRASTLQHSAFVAPAVACPHHEQCALAVACQREVLRGYADLHGLDELQPVRLGEVLAARR